MQTTTESRVEGLSLRALRVADAERLHALHTHPLVFHSGSVWIPHAPLERTREWIEKLPPSAVALVAEIGDTLVGCAELYPGFGRRAHTAGLGISVHPDWHRRGVGSALIAELLDVADRWLGLRRIELQAFADNAPAIALYRKAGFHVEAHQRGTVLRDGVLADGLLMARLDGDCAASANEGAGEATRSSPDHVMPSVLPHSGTTRSDEDRERCIVAIRAVDPSDMTALADLMGLPGVRYGTLGVSYRTPESMQSWLDRQRTRAGLIGFVATHADTVIGFAALTLEPPRRSHAGSLLMCVHDDWQGRGVGGQLLGSIIDCADRSLGLRRIELTVYVDNAPAIALYRRAGFEIEGCARGYALRDGTFADVYLMARTVAAPPFVNAGGTEQ